MRVINRKITRSLRGDDRPIMTTRTAWYIAFHGRRYERYVAQQALDRFMTIVAYGALTSELIKQAGRKFWQYARG